MSYFESINNNVQCKQQISNDVILFNNIIIVDIIELHELIEAINCLKSKACVDNDKVSAFIIKRFKETLVEPLYYILIKNKHIL